MINKTLDNVFKGDKAIWLVFFFLCIISIIEVYSASSQLTYHKNFLAPMVKHVFLLLWGAVFMVITVNIKCKYFKLMTMPLLVTSFVLLLLVFALGQATNGAQRWIPVLGMQFQPSEIAKGSLVLATAQILSAMQTEHGADRRAFKYILVLCAFIVPLIMVENLSTAALLCAVIFMMMLIGRVPGKQLGTLFGICVSIVALFFVAVMALGTDKNQQQNVQTYTAKEVQAPPQKEEGIGKVFHRFDTWKARIDKWMSNEELAPKDVDLDKDAQASHANIAIATSNVVGKGFGKSEEREWLPQAYSDFIYAIIIEELGIEGAFFVALLYIILLVRVWRIANRCENPFPAFLAMGLVLLLVTQALFNMFVAVGIFPVTGQPLPLISKGGTSSIINCIYLGVILSISRSAKKKNEGGRRAKPEMSVSMA